MYTIKYSMEWMAASLKDLGSIPGGGPKRFHDSFNFVFYIVGECISRAADTHLAIVLNCKNVVILVNLVILMILVMLTILVVLVNLVIS